MGVSVYTVKRGDTLSEIALNHPNDIAGNTWQARMNTLIRLNNIKDPNFIVVGQKLKFSESGTSGSSSSSTSSPITYSDKHVTFINFGLIASSDSGRDMVANWAWKRDNTEKFETRWVQYLHGVWVPTVGEVKEWEEFAQSTFTADADATMVGLKVLPVAKVEGDEEPEWSETNGNPKVEWAETNPYYKFADNPPKAPSEAPSVTIKDQTLTIELDIDPLSVDATHVQFNIVKDNKTSIHTSPNVLIDTDANHASYQYTVALGSTYRVRARCVKSNKNIAPSKWTAFSELKETKPSTPAAITVCRLNSRTDGTVSAYLEWTPVSNAETYSVGYSTVESDFETDNATWDPTDTDRTSAEIVDIESGHEYYFRVKAVNGQGESNMSPTAVLLLGEVPAAPTTWSYPTKSAFVGEEVELCWMHNARDNSLQKRARLRLKINDEDWSVPFIFENTTTDKTGDKEDVTEFSYGTCISHKGELHVELNTSLSRLENATIQWQVQTAGVTGDFSNNSEDWSTPRTLYIYEKPTLALSVVKDLADSEMIETLESFPFYIRAAVELESYELQRPIGYHLSIISNDYYETVDDAGRTKIVNVGDAVYSKYFDTTETLYVEMSADNIDLESGMTYTVQCAADMNTGLSVSNIDNLYDFPVLWTEASYAIQADISVDSNTYTAVIKPYCKDANGEFIENLELSVYRRMFDGSLVEIATHIPNNGTSVTDPHPSLDYARYRIIAKDSITGAVSFYDMASHPVNASCIVIQWDEEWSTFDADGVRDLSGVDWSGSLLKLNYNVEVSDSRKRDVEFVDYAGREHSVSYYGDKITENPSWSATIPRDDKETIYALRRLSLWKGDVYIREPSGMGFWAHVEVSFNEKYSDVVLPISLSITRVEGGV